MSDGPKTYLALGDSMSIDDYTGVERGGAVSQFSRYLGPEWTLIDRTADGCTIECVPTADRGDLITLTIGGNDALAVIDRIAEADIRTILRSHRSLLEKIREGNPRACLIIGNIYTPDFPLPRSLRSLLDLLNRGIAENIRRVDGRLADIFTAFEGHTQEWLCQQIEPNLAGATAIAELFKSQFPRREIDRW